MKYIFVTGGVVSSLGKGLAAASLGTLLELRGLRVVFQKFDPYLNVDPGTMNPFQHGEVYVLNDGAETDLDLGHYERFTNCVLSRHNNLTSGQVYESVILKERRGDYLGKTVQVIPHVTDEIKNRIRELSDETKYDIVITEIGGTTGDIEGLPFLEAIRQFILEVGPQNVVNMHVTLVPYIKAAGELKTKPTQQSVAKLREIGLQPQVLLCRTEHPLDAELRQKLSMFCNVSRKRSSKRATSSTPFMRCPSSSMPKDSTNWFANFSILRHPSPTSRIGDTLFSGSSARPGTSPSRWSENTSICRTPTKASTNRSPTPRPARIAASI